MMKKLIISGLIGVAFSSIAVGQNYNFEAKIKPVDTSGYHRVLLNPFLLGQLNPDMGDLRVFDQEGNEIPYFITQEPESSRTAVFKEYEIIEKHFKENEVSYLIFHNPEKKSVHSISIIVQNTDVKKRARLSGSNNNKEWFVIKNNYLLHSMHNNEETTDLKILNFPLSNFEYFKLEIDDYWKLPINILKVGYYDYEYLDGKITSFSIPIELEKDSAKTSYYKLQFKERTYLEDIQFTMVGADFYNRHTTILEKKERVSKNNKKTPYFSQIETLALNSNSDNQVSVGGISTDELYVQIRNLDDKPLQMEKVIGSYLNKYLVLDANPNNTYTIKFGNKNAQKPRYDIVVFKDEISNNIKVIGHQLPVKTKFEPISLNEKGLFDNKYIIWLIIGVVGFVLAFVSVKMMKEIGDKN